MGPLLFSLVVHRRWARVRQIGAAQGCDFAVLYFDVCIMAGPEEATARTVES